MTKHFVAPAMLLVSVFSYMTCHSPTQPPSDAFTIQLADTSCTKAWLDVHLDRSISQRTVEIMRDDSVVTSFAIMQTDTTVCDTGLQPDRAYTYVAQLKSGTSVSKPTSALRVQTLDTTSNSFSWTTYSFGNGGATSSLYDVAIVSENPPLAYAVGEIHADSGSFNAARWDGKSWHLIRIQFLTFCEQKDTYPYPGRSLFAFGPQDVWITSGSQIVHWDGQTQTQPACIPVSVKKLWGTSGDDLYAAGVNGELAHYDGSGWAVLPSGTSLDFQDIYGAWDAESKKYEILAVASSYPESLDRTILSINDHEVTLLSADPISEPLSSIWFVPARQYLAVGSGIFGKHHLSDPGWDDISRHTVTTYYTASVTGNGINDFFVVGAYGEFLHFNGKSWKSFMDQTGLGNGSYSSVAVKGNLVIAVGLNNNMAVITVGKR